MKRSIGLGLSVVAFCSTIGGCQSAIQEDTPPATHENPPPATHEDPPPATHEDPPAIELPGDPESPALAALTELKPTPSADADIEDGLIKTKLDVWLTKSATVGQVNAALKGICARIVSMRPGRRNITVGFVRAADEASLVQTRDKLAAAPGILFADLAQMYAPQILPPAPADAAANLAHLFEAKFPAAWNVSRLARKDCAARKVKILVNDMFGIVPPPAFLTEVPGFTMLNRPPELSFDTHGQLVTAVALARLDSGAPTGANPFPECLEVQGVNLVGLSMGEAIDSLSNELPPVGKLIVNRSVGIRSPNGCKTYCPADGFAQCLKAKCPPEGFSSADPPLMAILLRTIDWRREMLPRDPEMLVVGAAGNDRESVAGFLYEFFQEAHNSPDSLSADSSVFGPSPLRILQDLTLWSPPEPYDALYPILALDVDQARKVADYMNDELGPFPPAAPNFISVGSSHVGTRDLQESAFSNAHSDVLAVGEKIVALDGTVAAGTSFSAPQVAGLASYLWLLSSELHGRLPSSVTKQVIIENARTTPSGVLQIDAYAAVLSLDQTGAPTAQTAPVRHALLDVNGDGAFDANDVTLFADHLVNKQAAPDRLWERYDLNGDGITGGTGLDRFDLDRSGSIQFGYSVYSTEVTQTIAGTIVLFNEQKVTDLEILCYLAYSPLYTGDTALRDERIAVACGVPPPPTDGGGGGGGLCAHLNQACWPPPSPNGPLGPCCPGLTCSTPQPNNSGFCQ